MNRWMMIVAVLVATSGCERPVVEEGEAPSADYETEGLSGGADTLTYSRTALDEPLRARYLKEMLCEAVAQTPDLDPGTRAAFSDNCQSHEFRVTEQLTSQRVLYRDGRGITVGLKIEITGTNPQLSATGTLRRQFAHDYNLTWGAEAVVNLADSDRYLMRLAEEAGEYFDYGSTSFVDNVHPIALSDLPSSLDPVLEAELQSIEVGFNRGDHAELGEAFRVEHQNGDTAGYVVVVQFTIDDPLFDGGGTSLFINGDDVILMSVDFWG